MLGSNNKVIGIPMTMESQGSLHRTGLSCRSAGGVLGVCEVGARTGLSHPTEGSL